MTMNEVLVKLYVPMLDEQYDIWIPVNKKIYKILVLLVKSLNEFTKGYYKPTRMPILYDRITAKVYDVNLKVIDTDIRNGTEIVMI